MDLQVQLSTLNTCPSITTLVNPLCPSNDTSNVSFAERVCTCPPQCKAPQTSRKGAVSAAVVGAAGGGGALVLILVTLLVVYCCWRRSQARKIDNQAASGLASNILSPKKGSTSTSASSSSKGSWWLRCLGYGSDAALPNSTFSTSSTGYVIMPFL